MISPTVEQSFARFEGIAVESNVLEILKRQGPKTLGQLENELIHIESAQLLFAIDRLSRLGRIAIGPPRKGDYFVWLLPKSPAGTGQSDPALRNSRIRNVD